MTSVRLNKESYLTSGTFTIELFDQNNEVESSIMRIYYVFSKFS